MGAQPKPLGAHDVFLDVVIGSRSCQPKIARTALIAALAVLVGLLALAGPAAAREPGAAANAAKVVSYRGLRLRVPRGWPVLRLGVDSHVCVRFNRHAVYLGTPGLNQDCAASPVGRTEAILVSPNSYHGRLLTAVSEPHAQTAGGSMVRLYERRQKVVITATWARHPTLIKRMLGLHSLRAAALATTMRRPRPVPAPPVGRLPRTTSGAAPALPGEPYAGLGFDVCTTPSTASMAAWGQSSPYGAIGIYIGGVNAACIGGNLTPSWVSTESAAGWHMIPLYVGLQAPGNGCGCAAMSTTVTSGAYMTAATQGTAAAQDAVSQAQALGIGPGNPIYYDMEGYQRSPTTSGAVLAFLQAWTEQLHLSGYYSGVYSSGLSGITDLVANWGTSYVEPDELWTAAWDSSPPPTPPTSTANAYVPSADWPGQHQLLQYYSDQEQNATETYGGVRISIDRDFVNAPTAAFGSGQFVLQVLTTPNLTVTPRYDGSVDLVASWPGQPGITQYAVLAGPSATALSNIETVTAGATTTRIKLIDSYAYYAVQGLNSLGQVIGTSAVVQTPASVAIFGHSAYVGVHGPVGIPVACPNTTSPCQLQAAIFEGHRRLAHTGFVSVASQGGQLLVPLSSHTRDLVTYAQDRRLPVTVNVTSNSGVEATRPLNLIPYAVSGKAPAKHTWPSLALQILAQTGYVADAWTGGVLAACKLPTPCVSTARVTLKGQPLAPPRTVTLGAGEVGYLTFRLNKRAHEMLVAAPGNQLGARVTVTTGPKRTEALLSLVSFR